MNSTRIPHNIELGIQGSSQVQDALHIANHALSSIQNGPIHRRVREGVYKDDHKDQEVEEGVISQKQAP